MVDGPKGGAAYALAGRKDIPMRSVGSNHACFPQPWARWNRSTVIVVVIVVAGVALLSMQDGAVLITVVTALLGAIAQDVVRAAVWYRQQET